MKGDSDAKRTAAEKRQRLIEALLKVGEPLATKDRQAAAKMLRDDATPRRAVRQANSEFEQFAIFNWHKLKQYAQSHGRERWNEDQRMMAALTAIALSESEYPSHAGKLKPVRLLTLVDRPLNKRVKRKGDDSERVEPRNSALWQHFESLGATKGFMFDLRVPAAARRALTTKPAS